MQNLLHSVKWAQDSTKSPLAFRVTRHQSKLSPSGTKGDFLLMSNKIHNLQRALHRMHGLLIKPGETFSFWQCVGKPTKRRGYTLGPVLSRGHIRAEMGGGLCQLSSLIHWLALHSALEVRERYNHSVDLLPDHNRALPYGSDAAVFYNFKDLVLFNPTDTTFQLNLSLTDRHIKGELCATRPPIVRYHVYEKNPLFLKIDDRFFRRNHLWRDTHTRGHPKTLLKSEHLTTNFVRVLYIPKTYIEA